MADALCGPSNALQNFQKHAQVDRTLQRDRLISRQGPSQGFRSAAPNAGILDPEFEAFQAGLPVGPPQLHAETLNPFAYSHAPQQRAQPAPSLGGWASDFQRLHISSPRPTSAHQVGPSQITWQAPAVQQSPAASASWHTEFIKSSSMPIFQPHQIMQPNFSWAQAQGPETFMQPGSVQRQKQPIVDVPLDVAAFDRAFDAARDELVQAEADMQAEAERQAEEADTTLDSVLMELQEETNHLAAQERSRMAEWPDPTAAAQTPFEEVESYLPQHTDEDQQKPEEKPGPQDDDELSQVAGQLLDSVSHETSEKFQSSVFLELMRRLRDKEVRVDGENFVETSSNGTPGSSPIPSSP